MPPFTKIQLGMENIQFSSNNCGKTGILGALSIIRMEKITQSHQQMQAVLISHKTTQSDDKFENKYFLPHLFIVTRFGFWLSFVLLTLVCNGEKDFK